MSFKKTVANDRGGQEYAKLLREKVEVVVDAMKDNVEKAKKRGTLINDIEEEIEDIEQGAETFRELALENKKKHMWENYKMIIIGIILIGIICIVALISIFNTSEE